MGQRMFFVGRKEAAFSAKTQDFVELQTAKNPPVWRLWGLFFRSPLALLSLDGCDFEKCEREGGEKEKKRLEEEAPLFDVGAILQGVSGPFKF